MGKRAAEYNEALGTAQSLGFTVGSCVCLIFSVVFVAQVARDNGALSAPMTGERINPNEASVASLARLPRIGPTRAREIVAFRNRLHERTFQEIDDLGQVNGIGPATIETIRPWLRFDPPPVDGNEPPAG